MEEQSITICGLPESGKTTFLAALWHLVTSREVETVLQFESLRDGDSSHLNEIATRWRSARIQERTAVGTNLLVSMNLLNKDGIPVRLTFPDLSGEAYRRMWEERDCDPGVANILTESEGVLFFVHADKIKAPQWVVDVTAMSKKLELRNPNEQEVAWQSRFAPTQVQLVDLLQLLKSSQLNVRSNSLVVMLSAWDKVSVEGRSPKAFLAERLPLLDQYLRHSEWSYQIYGVSAQGGDYEAEDENLTDSQRAEIEGLRAMDCASRRIKLVSKSGESCDLTEPIAWLMS